MNKPQRNLGLFYFYVKTVEVELYIDYVKAPVLTKRMSNMRLRYLSILLAVVVILVGLRWSYFAQPRQTPEALAASEAMQASKPVVGLSQSHVDVNDALQGLKPAQSELNHSLDSVKDNQIETELNIVDPSSKDYLRLLALYREKQGPFMDEGIAYFYKDDNGNPYFLASSPALNELMSNDPDHYIELKVEEFNRIDEAYTDNWGGEFDALNVNFHYCKESTCLVRANHESVTFVREYLAQFEAQHSELDVTATTMASGDVVVLYKKRTPNWQDD